MNNAKKRYKVLSSSHVMDSKTFVRGDIIETHHDLAASFPNHFESVGSAPETDPIPAAGQPSPAISQESPPEDPPEVENDPDGDEGDEVGQETPDLTIIESPLGTNVTADFEPAADNGLLVFKKGGFYFLTDVRTPTVALNEKGLRAAAVPSELTTYFV